MEMQPMDSQFICKYCKEKFHSTRFPRPDHCGKPACRTSAWRERQAARRKDEEQQLAAALHERRRRFHPRAQECLEAIEQKGDLKILTWATEAVEWQWRISRENKDKGT
jgi:hypothetical protein